MPRTKQQIKKEIARDKAQLGETKKKKKGGWTDTLGKAAKLAIDLAPSVLPLLLAKHAPTMAAAQNAGVAGAAAPTVPLATGSGSVSEICGLRGIVPSKHTNTGAVSGMTVTTCDFVGDFSPSGVAGDLVWEALLSPMDPAFDGTKFAEFARAYEKYRIRRCVFVAEPACPATVVGAVTGAVFVDPLVDLEAMSPIETQRVVASQDGADTFSVWSAGTFSAPEGKTWLFLDPTGTDARLTMQGKAAMTLAADADGTGTFALYAIMETEYQTPSVAEPPQTGPALYVGQPLTESPGGDTWLPFGDGTNPVVVRSAGVSAQFENVMTATTLGADGSASPLSVSANAIRGLPSGIWMFTVKVNGTTISEVTSPEMTSELVNAGGQYIPASELGILHGDIQGSGTGVSTEIYWIPTMSPDVAQLVFFASMATITDASLLVSNLPTGVLFSFEPDTLARKSLMAATLQGQERARDRRIARLEAAAALAERKDRPTPSGPNGGAKRHTNSANRDESHRPEGPSSSDGGHRGGVANPPESTSLLLEAIAQLGQRINQIENTRPPMCVYDPAKPAVP